MMLKNQRSHEVKFFKIKFIIKEKNELKLPKVANLLKNRSQRMTLH